MDRFKNILLVCDRSSLHEELIRRTIALAKANGAHVTLVDVVDLAPGDLATVLSALPGLRSNEVQHEVLELHRARLAEIRKAFAVENVKATEVVLQGIPFLEIIKQVLRGQHDLLIKGVGGTVEPGPLFFGSTDLHLLRKCPCPVWMMNDSPARRYTRIIAAVDPDPEDPVRDALNNLVMTLATSISAADNGELHVVNAWYCDTAETLRHSAFARSSSEDINKLIYAERKIRKAYLDQLLAPYTNILQAHRIHLLNGIARQIIPSFARDRRADLIVMGTVGRTGVRGFFIGNTAEAILNQVACSVLAVKPPGFETPVMLDGPAADMASISSSA